MPNQDPTNNNPPQENTPVNPVSSVSFSPQADLPPLPPEFQNLEGSQVNPPTANSTSSSDPTGDSGSAAPPPAFANIAPAPKKKFGTKKIIATILGIIGLVGAVGAGTYLVGQKQLFQQKADTLYECSNAYCVRCTCGCTSSNADCSGPTNCNPDCPTATPVSTDRPNTCEENGFTCKTPGGDGHCPTGSYDRSGTCANGVCCYTPSDPEPTSRTGWGIGEACTNTSGTGTQCVLAICPYGCEGSCDSNDPGVTLKYGNCETLASEVLSTCGQVDLVNSSGVYCDVDPSDGIDAQITCPQPRCAVDDTPTSEPKSSPTPTPTTAAPYCAAVKAYDTEWEVLSSTDLTSLSEGSVVNFCVSGLPLSNSFDKAQFTINGVKQTETSVNRPQSAETTYYNEFCQSYTIPSGTTTFTVTGQIHHSTLGWF